MAQQGPNHAPYFRTVAAVIPVEQLLFAYAHGYFPMAEAKTSDVIHWIEPRMRGLLPLDDRFHVSKNVHARMRSTAYEIRHDTDVEGVMRGCAERPDTWISESIIASYLQLHQLGYAHSTEVWLDGRLIGGQYGVALGRAFFGESMFRRAPDADKVALYHTWQWLRSQGFVLWDTQFWTPHLAQFGGYQLPQRDYLRLLQAAISG